MEQRNKQDLLNNSPFKVRPIWKRAMAILLICVFAPLAVLFFTINQQAYVSLEQSMLENNLHAMKAFSTSLDDLFSGMISIRDDLLLNDDLLTGYTPDDYANARHLQKLLKSYTTIYPKFFEIIVHTGSDQYLFSSSTSYTQTTLQSRFGLSDDLTEKIMQNSLSYPLVISASDTYYNTPRFLLFIMPVGTYQTDKTLIIGVPQVEIISLFENTISPQDGEIWIFDHNTTLVFHSHSTTPTAVYDYIQRNKDELAEFRDSAGKVVEINNIEYYISARQTEHFGLQLLHITPTKPTALRAIEQRNRWTIIFSLFFTLTACIILLVNYLTYAPIKHLLKHINGSDEAPSNYNLSKRLYPEASYIISYISQIEDSNSQLALHLQGLRNDWHQTLFTRILLGEIQNWENLARLSDSQDFFSRKSGFFLFAIRPHDYMVNDREMKMISETCQCSDNIRCITMQFSDLNLVLSLILLSSCDGNDQYSYLHDITPKLQTLLKQTFSMGACKIYTDISYSQQALVEAVSACHHAFTITPTDTIVSDFDCNNQNSWFLQAQAAFPSDSDVVQMDINTLSSTLSTLRSYLTNSACDIGLAQYFSYKILSWLNDVIVILTQDSKVNLYPYIVKIIGYNSIDDIDQYIQICSQELLEKIVIHFSERQDILFHSMLAYIDLHISDADFSLTAMADHFSMSLPIISNYFKQQTGSSIMNYMVLKRIEKSCELLTNTKLSVKEVGMQVGYINDSSYIRRFKSVMGISPGQYRMDPDKYKIPLSIEDK